MLQSGYPDSDVPVSGCHQSQHGDEATVVEFTHATPDPETMVVKFCDAALADSTVLRPVRLYNPTLVAVMLLWLLSCLRVAAGCWFL